MQLEFWQSIQNDDYSIPNEHSLEELTLVLLSQIGTIDATLREIAYDILSEWILEGHYSSQQLSELIRILQSNLQTQLDQMESDSVFLRSFSVLLLGEIINHDNEANVLSKSEVLRVLEVVLGYLEAENDTRGFVEGKGWAHALEHSKMALSDIAKSPHLAKADLDRISLSLRKRGLSIDVNV